MAEQNLTTSDPSDVTRTTDIIQKADGNGAASSSMEFYTRCAVVVIGVIGTATNALILYALVVSKQHKKQMLIFNQNVLDLFSSVFLIISYAVMLCNFDLARWYGPWLCKLMYGEFFIWVGTNGSIINLGMITVERYLKVIHSAWSKKNLRRWMIYVGMAFAWISSIMSNIFLAYETSEVIDGYCYPIMVWKNDVARMVYGVWYFLSYYDIILFMFIFCYGRILVAVRRQAKVMAGHSATASSTAQTKQIKTNVIKTMVIVSFYFALTWLPLNIYFLISNLNIPVPIRGYYATMSFAFLYTCSNPFIYAVKFDPVKEVLVGLMPCKKSSVQPVGDIPATGNRGLHVTAHN